MRDEDFTLGYVCGYNDGDGSASGGSWLDDIPLIKKYKLVGTDCAIGIANPESDKVKIVTSWQYYTDGDNSTVMDRIKWCSKPYYFYKPIILIFFIGGKSVGYHTPYSGIYSYFSYTNAVNTPPYSDTWVLSRKSEQFYDELKIEAVTKVTEYTPYTNERCTARILYTYHDETWDSSSDKTVIGSVSSQRSVDIFEKSRDTYSSGNVRVRVDNYIRSQITAVGNQWIKPENLRDVLDAWFKCTGIEEVQI